jgi:hypothetical protein
MAEIKDVQEVSHRTPQTTTTLSKEIPKVSDPVKFMNDFEESGYYKKAFAEFFKGKTLAADVIDEEKEEAFYQSDNAKFALFDFAEKEEGYNYDYTYFPQNVREVINCYVDQTRDLLNHWGEWPRDEIISADRTRSEYHNQLAQTLKEAGFVKSFRLGKAFARLILIDRGLESFDDSKISDFGRLRRVLSAA